jgi:hypothetical protein
MNLNNLYSPFLTKEKFTFSSTDFILKNVAMIGEVKMYTGSSAPDGWAFCRGQLLPVSEYAELYSIMRTTYGGDGVITFGLPDLRSAVPMGIGQGVALPERKPAGDGRNHTMLKKGEYTDPESSRYDLGFIKLNFIIKVA